MLFQSLFPPIVLVACLKTGLYEHSLKCILAHVKENVQVWTQKMCFCVLKGQTRYQELFEVCLFDSFMVYSLTKKAFVCHCFQVHSQKTCVHLAMLLSVFTFQSESRRLFVNALECKHGWLGKQAFMWYCFRMHTWMVKKTGLHLILF